MTEKTPPTHETSHKHEEPKTEKDLPMSKPVKEEVVEEKKEKKEKKAKIVKKELAVARSNGLHISLKHAMYISRFIRGKTVDVAMADLRQVIAFKRAVPFKGEIPHRKGPMMSGRYPITAAGEFITTLRALRGNILVNGLELDKAVITTSNPSWASRPMRRGGTHGKRVNLLIEAREPQEKKHG